MSTVIDLSTLGRDAGFIIQGDGAGDQAGFGITAAGDFNGDGFDDIIVGAIGGDDGGTDAGEAYVIFGRAGGFGTVDGTGRRVLDLTSLAPADGFIIQGDSAGDEAGRWVASAGDVNGDGFDDLILGARLGDDGGMDAGEAYVLFGRAGGFGTIDGTGRRVIDLTSLAPADGFVIQGDTAGDETGDSVASAGDINHDGFADLIVGAYGGLHGSGPGEAYVLYGRAGTFGAIDGSGRAVIDLGALAPADGFVIPGDQPLDFAGFSVASAGDINGDGFADFIVGADGGDDGAPEAGEAYVFLGRAGTFGAVDGSGRRVVDLSSFAPADGFIVQGDAMTDLASRSVSSAGDINGDGFDDFIVSGHFGDDGGTDAGEAYVLFGHAGTFGAIDGTGRRVIDLASLSPADGFVVQGDEAGDLAGRSVSAAGDVNGDGFDDFIIGAHFGDDGGVDAGEAYVIFGRAGAFGAIDGTGRRVIDLTSLDPADGFIIQGDEAGDLAGQVSSGDVNGDGFSDLIVGAYRGDDGGSEAGEAYVVFGIAPTTAVTRTGTTAGQTLAGGGGDDVLDGLDGDDRLFGNGGDDHLEGGAGADRLAGGTGNDAYVVDSPADIVVEGVGEGFDVVYSRSDYTLGDLAEIEILSSVGQDATTAMVLVGNGFDQTIYGNAGANFLQGGGGTDYLIGLGGNDIYFVAGPGDNVVESVGGGSRDAIYTPTDYQMRGGVEVEVLSSSNQAGTSAQTLIGNAFAQEIYGNAGVNFIEGGGGADTLVGLGGNDVYVVDSADDYVAENAGGGAHDVVFAKASYALAAGQEIEVLSTSSSAGTAAIDLTGNNLANELYGNAGANVLNGGAGADYLVGYGGADTFQFTTALGGGNVDQLADFAAVDDTIALDDSVFAGLTPGALPASAFVAGSAAGDIDDRIIYNSATGQILFDADGSGGAAAILFATVQPGTALTASDFTVI